jgi:hypothetical protein
VSGCLVAGELAELLSVSIGGVSPAQADRPGGYTAAGAMAMASISTS